MKDCLFTTELIVEGSPSAYQINFEDNQYVFKPIDLSNPPLSIIREKDEWHIQGNVNEVTGRQAISALEHYLLSQH